MDHTEATAEQLVEKYVLDELEDETAERFEEHYFECAECANDLRSAVTLMRYGAELPQEQEAANVVPITSAPRFKTWLSTAAAAVIGFIVAVPMFRAPAPVPMLSIGHDLGVEAGQSRDAGGVQTIVAGEDDVVIFVVDVVPGATEYTVTVRGEDGKTIGSRRVAVNPDAITVSLTAQHLPAGTYRVDAVQAGPNAPPAATRTFRVQRKEGES